MVSPNPIAQFLTQRPLMLLDGALATELERRGADLHDVLWSAKVLMEQSNLIRAVHRDYFEAGVTALTQFAPHNSCAIRSRWPRKRGMIFGPSRVIASAARCL